MKTRLDMKDLTKNELDLVILGKLVLSQRGREVHFRSHGRCKEGS